MVCEFHLPAKVTINSLVFPNPSHMLLMEEHQNGYTETVCRSVNAGYCLWSAANNKKKKEKVYKTGYIYIYIVSFLLFCRSKHQILVAKKLCTLISLCKFTKSHFWQNPFIHCHCKKRKKNLKCIFDYYVITGEFVFMVVEDYFKKQFFLTVPLPMAWET